MMARGLAVRDCAGVGVRMAGSLTDVTEGKVSDPLTGLANRLMIADRVDRAMERSRRDPETRFAVLFLDLDRFKLVNDCFGHLTGDQLLIAFARRLEGCVGSIANKPSKMIAPTIARLGGDEFTILLEGIDDIGDAVRVAELIQHDLASPFSLGSQEVFTTASIGIAYGSAGYQRADDLLRDADTAMYDAKSQGKARIEVFDAAMRARALNRLQLETELRGALDRAELRLHYQPVFSIQTGRLIGFEALVRWQHPDRGLLATADFSVVAEETALVIPIGWWAFDQVCRQVRLWHDQFHDAASLTISVKLSPKQYAHKDLVAEIEKRLDRAGLDGHWLKIEITESAIMSDPETAAVTLGALRSLGVQLGIDDFGTGQSSLSYLQRFPIDTLKIDRTFINRLTRTTKDHEIVQAIVSFAHNLGINVVAEGVESTQQLDALVSMGCEYIQGYQSPSLLDGANAEQMLAGCLRKFAPTEDNKACQAVRGFGLAAACLT
jgi:diguanylate cyclase (GGDEF)-like protein